MDNKKNDTLEGFKKFSHDYVVYMQELKNSVEGIGTFWKDTDYNELCAIYDESSEVIEQISKAFFLFNDMLSLESNTNNSEVKEM